MKMMNQYPMRRALIVGAGLIVLHVTAVATVLAEEQKGGDVGTRAVPGAPPQQGQMPTFPQKFEVRGPETDSFGFAVTQPGPITVDVQAQGAPVTVTLQNLAGQPMAQQGTGHVHLAYQVMPQDVQKSALWVVRIKLAQPALPLGATHATGTVMVQHPPADPGAVQAQVSAATAQNQAGRQREDHEAEASFNAQFEAHKAKVEQERQQRQAAERAQNQPLVDQLRTKAGSAVRSRGIEGDAPAGEGGEIGSRALAPSRGTLSPSATPPLGTVPFGSTAITPPPPPPAPVINNLSKSQGQPKDQVIITGRNFGNAVGDVVFQLGPNVALPALVETVCNGPCWSDTMIVVDVPDASGLLPFDGGVFIPMGQIQSNTVPFHFTPAQEVRMTHTAKGDMSVAQPGSYTTSSAGWDHITHPNTTTWRLGGAKGNDIVFPTTRLKNGWVVQNITVSTAGCVCSDGVYVADSRVGTDTLFFNARWWYDALSDANYDFAVWIIGPRGVPDGIVMP
jgi:hypothetical protein